jgi:signal transduction histidine kinase
LTFVNDVDNDFRIYADMESILTVMKNIISNSIKYSNDGGQIIVDAKASGKKLQMIFKDFGRGIPQEEIDHIFRIDLHKGGIGNNNLEGSGLGLVLCRELIEKNNGSIKVESAVGEGTTIVIELPLLEIQKDAAQGIAVAH